jgi:RNA polymerase sigma factor (sigma-70 family)
MLASARSRTDAELLRAAGLDADAYAEIYGRYRGRIFGYFLRRTKAEDTALELTAETFARVWIARRGFEDERDGSAAPWLFTIARNVLLMSVRRGAVEREVATRLGILEQLEVDGGEPPEPSWIEGADELLNTLPPSQRDALRLRIVDELEYDQVAEALGTSPATARVRVHRGLAALRSRLSRPKENSDD